MTLDLADLKNGLSDLWQRTTAALASGDVFEGWSRPPAATAPVPASIACVERVRYHVDIDERVDYSGLDVTGEVRVRVPCTPQYIPWSLNRRYVNRPVPCGRLHFRNCAEAGLFDEETMRAYHSSQLDFHLPLRMPFHDMSAHFASGDDLEGIYSYHPRMAWEFPVTVMVTLSDARREDGHASTYLDDLRLQIEIQARVSNLSQEMEKETLGWIKESAQQAKRRYEAWSRAVEAMEGKQKLDQDALRDLERTSAPSPAEAEAEAEGYGTLSHAIEQLQEELRHIKGEPLAEDLFQALDRALKAHPDGPPAHRQVRAWLRELGQRVSRVQGLHFRYIGIEWPLPEAAMDWPKSGAGFPGEGGWTYNSEAGRLEYRDLVADWVPASMRYEGRVDLPLQRPARERQMARGTLVVEVERLLSGLDVDWEPEKESTSDAAPSVSRTSIVEISFQVDLNAVFARRNFAVSRSLVFEGLLPSIARMREVQDVLSDAGLTVLSDETAIWRRSDEVVAIWRREGLPAHFRAMLRGKEESAKHTVIFDGTRQQVERSIVVGSLTIELRGRGAGDPQPVVDKINEILLRLQQRWGQGDVSVWQGTWYREA